MTRKIALLEALNCLGSEEAEIRLSLPSVSPSASIKEEEFQSVVSAEENTDLLSHLILLALPTPSQAMH